MRLFIVSNYDSSFYHIMTKMHSQKAIRLSKITVFLPFFTNLLYNMKQKINRRGEFYV